uniref:Uncharacterized protein AlNc14C203G8750 n=1 Tax=Albugo laibachii Nc14 TaxID=890382 RepID=F0W7X2_9STRA|nr:conserved hypothetical protein [Albugo laibachii Nc14]CCA23700.1 conserved hypothetical protein [Albugo laibachii Nc14]|eukprot:CCA23700.1 conserved hypothetical protein [Albugo laibachii Nc14]
MTEFRKRSKKVLRRKRTREEIENCSEDMLAKVAEILEEQKVRVFERIASKCVTSKQEGTKKVTSSSFDDKLYGLHDPSRHGSANEKLIKLLDGQFTGQTENARHDHHMELMNRYIEDRLGSIKVDSKDDKSQDSIEKEDDALYALSTDLAPTPTTNETNSSDGVLIWNTGIAEVELPSTYKNKIVEATKSAINTETVPTSSISHQNPLLPSNLSTNFNRHRHEFISDMKKLPRDEQRERGFKRFRNNESSDDAAVLRFRKFECRKLQ